jgi:putative transcriptional regulator
MAGLEKGVQARFRTFDGCCVTSVRILPIKAKNTLCPKAASATSNGKSEEQNRSFPILQLRNTGERIRKMYRFTVDHKPKTMFKPLEVDRNNMTIMGVPFSDLKTLESTANALGSNMFEGFNPTPKGVEIIRDYVTGKVSLSELVTYAKEKAYV